jgi:hypothetical protein
LFTQQFVHFIRRLANSMMMNESYVRTKSNRWMLLTVLKLSIERPQNAVKEHVTQEEISKRSAKQL